MKTTETTTPAWAGVPDPSGFALNVIEKMIVDDYLSETWAHTTQIFNSIPNKIDWWDIGHKSYAEILSIRHKHLKFAELMKGKQPNRPDLSTYNGPPILGGTTDIKTRRGRGMWNRREIYEIKPDTPDGHRKAQQKLTDVEAHYRSIKIAGIYKRGISYPRFGSKLIRPRTSSLQTILLKYLLKELLPFRIRIIGFRVKVRRPEPGVLLYKVSVLLDVDREMKKEWRWRAATYAIRMWYVSDIAVNQPSKLREVLKYLDRLESIPEDPGIDPRKVEKVIAGRNLHDVPFLKLAAHNLQIDPRLLTVIRNTMYTRQIGLPGETYLIGADETWYNTNIREPGRASVDRSMQHIRSAMVAGSAHVSLFAVREKLTTGERIAIVVVATVVIVGAAASIVLTGATDLPVAGPTAVAAGATAEAAIFGEAVTVGGAGFIPAEMVAVHAGAETATAIAPSAVSLAGASADAAASAGSLSAGAARPALDLAQVLARGTAAELQSFRSAQVIDEMLAKVLTDVTKDQIAKAIVSAGVLVPILFTVTSAHASAGEVTEAATLSNAGTQADVNLGGLYVLKLRENLPTQLRENLIPHAKFRVGQYSARGSESQRRNHDASQLYFLGTIEVQ